MLRHSPRYPWCHVTKIVKSMAPAHGTQPAHVSWVLYPGPVLVLATYSLQGPPCSSFMVQSKASVCLTRDFFVGHVLLASRALETR